MVGRNGVGKSTLLQVIAGIIDPDQGSIDLGGTTATLLSLGAGMQDTLTGRENAMISGMLLGLGRDEIRAKLPAIAEFSELGEFFNRPVNSYSAGMRARLGFSTGIQLQPDVLLIDEVLGVGDAKFRAKCTKLLTERMESEQTVVLVAHGPEMLARLCDRVLWIDEGVARKLGEAESVLEEYIDALGFD